MGRFVAVALVVGVMTLAVGSSLARLVAPMSALDRAGFASDELVAASVGPMSIEANCPSGRFRDGSREGGGRITLMNPGTGWRKPGVLATLLRDALIRISEQCNTDLGYVGDVVPLVEIFARETEQGSPVLVVRAERYSATLQQWLRVRDIQEEQRQESIKIQQAATRDAQFQAERVAQAQAAAAQAQRIAEANALSAAKWDRFWSDVWFWIKVALWCAAAAWLFSKRETLMRWYYSLTPHPATGMVEATMHRRAELDGRAFAEIMRPIPGGRIEKEVRAEQARKLALRAQQYAESMRAEADRIKAKAQQETDFIRAQDDLTKAALAHEKAKAALDALRKRVG